MRKISKSLKPAPEEIKPEEIKSEEPKVEEKPGGQDSPVAEVEPKVDKAVLEQHMALQREAIILAEEILDREKRKLDALIQLHNRL